MGDKSQIQWTDATWNPVTGCSKVSPGCANCYAETIARRLWPTQYPHVFPGMPDDIFEHRPRQFTDVQCHEDRLDQPLRWKRGRRIFVNSMSDLFHEDVPDAFIDRVFAVMALTPQHTFQVLTKRAERMRDYLLTLTGSVERMDDLCADAVGIAEAMESDALDAIADAVGEPWPLENVWLGVSVENQRFADERIPLLLQTPTAVRFISAEPLLGSIDLRDIPPMRGKTTTAGGFKPLIHFSEYNALNGEIVRDRMGYDGQALDWVIVGGESGTGARPFDVSWARSIVAQCQAAGVPVFVKQLGAVTESRDFADLQGREAKGLNRLMLRDRKGGDMAEWPEDLRVREMPSCGC